MKRYLRKLQIALSLCVLFSLVLVRGGTAAAPSIIDHFSDAQTLSIDLPGNNNPPITAVGSATGPNILGGERDLIATVSNSNPADGNTETYTAIVSDHSLNISSDTNLLFTTEIQWDGSTDVADKSVIVPTGLGGVNLTTGGQNRFIFGLPASDVGGQFTMRVYSSATACSQSVWNFPGAINAFNMAVLERAYGLFTTICPGGGYSSLANFSSVGAISLSIATSITSPSLDMSIDLVGQDIAPYKDYGDLPDDGASSYPYEYFKDITLANAFHVDTGLKLGPAITLENAKLGVGTDFNAAADANDDGITPSGLPWTAGTGTGHLSVIVSGCPTSTCYLTAFVDWNQDGSFWFIGPPEGWQAGERILSNSPVSNGTQTVNFDIPSIAGVTDNWPNQVFFTRFRITDTPFAQGTAWGAAFSGEVEDYKWTFSPTAIKVEALKATSPVTPLQPILPFAAALVIAAGAGLAGLVLRRK